MSMMKKRKKKKDSCPNPDDDPPVPGRIRSHARGVLEQDTRSKPFFPTGKAVTGCGGTAAGAGSLRAPIPPGP